MRIFKNKPFIFLVAVNIIYLMSQLEYHSIYHDAKQNVAFLLGEIGVEKYKRPDRGYSTENLAIYFNKTDSIKIPTIESGEQAEILSANSNLVLSPGIYEWGGEKYNMNKEGYYYFVDFEKKISRNFVVYDNNVKSLLSSLSWLQVHGSADAKLSYTQKKEKLKTKKLSLTCGSISSFAHNILKEQGIESRLAMFLTMDEWNSYDNGHTLLEVKIDGQWILFDIDSNQYFGHRDNTMNIKSFFDTHSWDNIDFIPLSSDENLDTQGFGNKSISYHGFSDYTFNDIRKWYKRVMQVPMIIENGIYNVALKNNDDKNRVLKYLPNANLLTVEQFNRRFYGENQ